YSLQAEIREQPSLRMTIGLGKFVGWQGRYDGGKWRSHMEFLGRQFSFQGRRPPQPRAPGKKGRPRLPRGITKEVVVCSKTLMRDLIWAVKPRLWRLHGRVGLAEPDGTGYLVLFLTTIKELFPGADLQIEPLWEEEYYDLDLTVAGRILLILPLLALLKYGFSRPIRPLWMGRFNRWVPGTGKDN
ncbi:MAG: hypothetical protein ACOYD6_10115, partial [Limnochordia bacterium]